MKNRVFEAALEIQRFCEERHYRFCVIAGVALQRRGEDRNPNDADVTVITGFGEEERFIDALPSLAYSTGIAFQRPYHVS